MENFKHSDMFNSFKTVYIRWKQNFTFSFEMCTLILIDQMLHYERHSKHIIHEPKHRHISKKS